MTEKVCVTCQVTKPLSSFLQRSDTGNYKRRCRECENLWHKANYRRIAPQKKLASAENFAKPEKKQRRKAYLATRVEQDRVWNKNYKMERAYGIDIEVFSETLKAQHYHCPICSKHMSADSRHWHVDHNHTTGAVRGIICSGCNLLLGHAKDNTATLRAAAEYLEKNK